MHLNICVKYDFFYQFFNGNVFKVLSTTYFQESGMRNLAHYWLCWWTEVVINTFLATLKVSPDVLHMQVLSARLFCSCIFCPVQPAVGDPASAGRLD